MKFVLKYAISYIMIHLNYSVCDILISLTMEIIIAAYMLVYVNDIFCSVYFVRMYT